MPHVMLNTIVRNTYLGGKTANATTSASATSKVATATRPATDTGTNVGSIVFGSTCNYMKIHPWAASGNPIIRVIGWALCNDTRLWIPHLIAEVTMASLRSVTTTINGTALKAAASLTKGAGDAKLFAPSADNADAYFVVDSQGFELVELHFYTSAGIVVNAHVGEM